MWKVEFRALTSPSYLAKISSPSFKSCQGLLTNLSCLEYSTSGQDVRMCVGREGRGAGHQAGEVLAGWVACLHRTNMFLSSCVDMRRRETLRSQTESLFQGSVCYTRDPDVCTFLELTRRSSAHTPTRSSSLPLRAQPVDISGSITLSRSQSILICKLIVFCLHIRTPP